MLLRESLLDKNEIIIDEKRRLAVNMRNLTSFQNKIYHRNYFKTFRPDLNSLDAFVFQQKWKLGEQFLNELSRSFNVELTRMHLHTPMSDINKKMRVFPK